MRQQPSQDTSPDFFLHQPPLALESQLIEHPQRGLSVQRPNGSSSNVTLLDLFSLRKLGDDPAHVRQCVRQIILACLGMDLFNREKTNLDVISYLNTLVQSAKKFLQDGLQYSLPQEIANLQISTANQIIEVFEKSSRFRKRKAGYGPAYCALLKACYVMHELHHHDYVSFDKQTEYLARILTDTGNIRTVRREASRDEVVSFLHLDDAGNALSFFLNTRPKGWISSGIKMLRRPEADISSIITDGIGFFIEAKHIENIPSLISFFVRLLLQTRLVVMPQNTAKSPFSIENKGLYEATDFSKIIENINLSLRPNDKKKSGNVTPFIAIATGPSNSCSDTGYRRIHLNMLVKVPKEGDAGGMMIDMPFEIQFDLCQSSSTSGMGDHSIYAEKRRLFGISRLDGSVSTTDILRPSSRTLGRSDKISRHLQNLFSSISHDRSMSIDHWKRLAGTGLLPPALNSLNIEHVRSALGGHHRGIKRR